MSWSRKTGIPLSSSSSVARGAVLAVAFARARARIAALFGTRNSRSIGSHLGDASYPPEPRGPCLSRAFGKVQRARGQNERRKATSFFDRLSSRGLLAARGRPRMWAGSHAWRVFDRAARRHHCPDAVERRREPPRASERSPALDCNPTVRGAVG